MEEASGTGRALYVSVSIQAIAQRRRSTNLARAAKPSRRILYCLRTSFGPSLATRQLVRGTLLPYLSSAWKRGWVRRESRSESFCAQPLYQSPRAVAFSRQSIAFSDSPERA